MLALKRGWIRWWEVPSPQFGFWVFQKLVTYPKTSFSTLNFFLMFIHCQEWKKQVLCFFYTIQKNVFEDQIISFSFIIKDTSLIWFAEFYFHSFHSILRFTIFTWNSKSTLMNFFKSPVRVSLYLLPLFLPLSHEYFQVTKLDFSLCVCLSLSLSLSDSRSLSICLSVYLFLLLFPTLEFFQILWTILPRSVTFFCLPPTNFSMSQGLAVFPVCLPLALLHSCIFIVLQLISPLSF